MSAAVRRSVAMVLVGLVAGVVLMMVWPANAHHRRSFSSLRRRVNTLEYQMNYCIGPVGVASFGRPDEGEGYVYRTGPNEFLVTGLDVVGDPAFAQYFMATISPDCVGPTRSQQRGFELVDPPASRRRT